MPADSRGDSGPIAVAMGLEDPHIPPWRTMADAGNCRTKTAGSYYGEFGSRTGVIGVGVDEADCGCVYTAWRYCENHTIEKKERES